MAVRRHTGMNEAHAPMVAAINASNKNQSPYQSNHPSSHGATMTAVKNQGQPGGVAVTGASGTGVLNR